MIDTLIFSALCIWVSLKFAKSTPVQHDDNIAIKLCYYISTYIFIPFFFCIPILFWIDTSYSPLIVFGVIMYFFLISIRFMGLSRKKLRSINVDEAPKEYHRMKRTYTASIIFVAMMIFHLCFLIDLFFFWN